MLRLLLLSILFSSIQSFSQSVMIGRGSFGGTNVFGPLYAVRTLDTAFSKQAYIYNASLLSGLKHGDTISSLDFYSQADTNMIGQVNFKIYLKMTASDTFANGSLNFKNEINSIGMVLVYDSNPIGIMDGSNGYKNFAFNVNNFLYDTIGNKKNLEVVMVYQQFKRQASNTNWLYESNFTVSAFRSNNEGKINYGRGIGSDTSIFSDIRKPHLRINFPRYSNNLTVLKTYCLGKVPLLANVNDSIKVRIGNRGKRSVTGSKLYLKITGANQHIDSITLGKIDAWADYMVAFSNFRPDSSGTDQIEISLSKDDFSDNNYDTILREINYNVYSHCDPFIGNSGGIGFNGSTGDFVAKFYTDTAIYINQVSVDFSASGNGFRVGIWDDDSAGGLPGTVLFMSDSLTSVGGTYILPVLPRVRVNNGFFVGIRQNTVRNVAFSYQEESPIRDGAFYFTAPMGNTNWVPFSPGFPFKFNIQPRIQVGDDVSPLGIIKPFENEEVEYSIYDSLAPRARIINYGFKDQDTAFDVECKIYNAFSLLEYSSSKKITVKSGQTAVVDFDRTFKLYNLGNHSIEVTTKLPNDKVQDNNTIKQSFKVIVKHDIGVDLMFTPYDGGIYEYKLDTFTPTVRINNFGTTAKTNFNVVFNIKNDTGIIYSETLNRSLPAGLQEIISFKAYVPNVTGDFIAECYTSLIDSIPYNDTIRNSITFQKSNDVGPVRIKIPNPNTIYTMGGLFFSKLDISNFGFKNQLIPFLTHMYVYDPSGKEVFYDTVSTQLGGFSTTELSFKRFNIPLAFGQYKVFYRTQLNGDQEPLNDTLTGFFTVIPNLDLGVLKLLLPTKDTVLAIENLPIKPEIIVKNYGSSTLGNVGPLVLQIFEDKLLVYEDSLTIKGNLSYNSELKFILSKDFNLSSPGIFTLKVFTRLPGDLIPKNDTLLSRFVLRRNYDLALDTNTNYTNGQVFQYGRQVFKPQILIINNGAIRYNKPFTVSIDLLKSDTIYKQKTLSFDSINRSETISTFLDSIIDLTDIGMYKLCAKINANLDLYNLNDSFCYNFSIVKPLDLALDSILFPDKINYCYQDKTYRPRVKASNLGSSAIVNTLIDFKIYETTNYIWAQTRYVDLAPGESKWILFDSTLTFPFIGTAHARAISYLNQDLEKRNDTTRLYFNIAKTSAISSLNEEAISIFPNPTDNRITLTMDNAEKVQISILDLSGKILFSNSLMPDNLKIIIDLSENLGLNKGVYFIEIKKEDRTLTKKLILY